MAPLHVPAVGARSPDLLVSWSGLRRADHRTVPAGRHAAAGKPVGIPGGQGPVLFEKRKFERNRAAVSCFLDGAEPAFARQFTARALRTHQTQTSPAGLADLATTGELLRPFGADTPATRARRSNDQMDVEEELRCSLLSVDTSVLPR